MEQKAQILDRFLAILICSNQVDINGVISYLRGDGFEAEKIFTATEESPLFELFDSLSDEEARAIFREHFSSLLCEEVGAKSASINFE